MTSPVPQSFLHTRKGPFRDAVLSTAEQAGLNEGLVEKDYFCSLVLAALGHGGDSPLVFKGGTCLSKAYLDFYRLSEDLDFVIPVSCDTSKAERSRLVSPVRDAVDEMAGVPGLRVTAPLAGHNQSRQYIALLEYDSVVGHEGSIVKVEVGLREPMLRATERRSLNTLVTDPFTGLPVVPPFPFAVMALEEIGAEKVRAALTRREPAIRDFFDLDRIAEKGLELTSPALVELVRAKLAVPGNPPPDLSEARLAPLAAQVNTHLRPVLRSRDFVRFDISQSVARVRHVLDAVASGMPSGWAKG